MKTQLELSGSASVKIRNTGIVCAFLVVLIHCRPRFEPHSVGWFAKEILENGIAHIAVPFFFAVTGYMLAKDLATKGYKSLLMKRVRTLVVPFFIWNILFWLIWVMGTNAKALINNSTCDISFMSLRQFGLWYSGCPMLSPLWYVRAILVMALMSPVLLWCVRKFGLVFLAFLYVLYGVLCPFWPLSHVGGFSSFFRVGIFPVLGLFYVTLGMAIREGVVSRRYFPLSPCLSLIVGIVLVMIRTVVVYENLFGAEYWGFASVPFVLFGLYGIMTDKTWPQWLVMNSFAVYLIHKFVLLFLMPIMKQRMNILAYLCGAMLAFSLSLVITIMLKRFSPRLSGIMFGGR